MDHPGNTVAVLGSRPEVAYGAVVDAALAELDPPDAGLVTLERGAGRKPGSCEAVARGSWAAGTNGRDRRRLVCLSEPSANRAIPRIDRTVRDATWLPVVEIGVVAVSAIQACTKG